MCGIVALLLADSDGHANQDLYDALTALQHRGQGEALLCVPEVVVGALETTRVMYTSLGTTLARSSPTCGSPQSCSRMKL